MRPVLLLDTHICIRWIHRPAKLTREQLRALREAQRRRQPLALSAMSLLELATHAANGNRREGVPFLEILAKLEGNPAIEILPITFEIAHEVATLGPALRDPADRAIVATARVHALRLVTSDERIIASGVVPVLQ